jgi:hypothetical protein
MNGRSFLRFLAFLVLVAVAVGIGTAVYNAGVTSGLSEAARVAAASGEPLPIGWPNYGYGGPYAHGPFGFGPFAVLFWILGFFLIIGLLRFVFGGPGGGRGGGHRGWGGDRRDRIEEWHREMHRGDAGEPGGRTSGERPGGERPAGA